MANYQKLGDGIDAPSVATGFGVGAGALLLLVIAAYFYARSLKR
jgi:hypothetical protein